MAALSGDEVRDRRLVMRRHCFVKRNVPSLVDKYPEPKRPYTEIDNSWVEKPADAA